MDTQNQIFENTEAPKPNKKHRKRPVGLILFLLVLILALAGGAAYYLYQRRQPEEALKSYLQKIQEMDFEGMAGLLQSSDLTALDEADLRDAAYTDFFKMINEKMTYEITGNQFSIQDGPAQVTARIQYIDGSDIYKEAITEFLRQIVSSAFSGEELTQQQTRETLSSILMEKAQASEDKFTSAEIVYPMIKTTEGWKVSALDEETVKIMSANFQSVEDEVNQSLSDMESGSGSAQSEVPKADSTDRIDMETEQFSIKFADYKTGKDFGGEPCLFVYYDYTNKGDAPSSAIVDVSLQAYQNGTLCETAIPAENEEAIDHYMDEIKPGKTIRVCQVFSLQDQSDVTLSASEAFSLSGGASSSQILTLS